MWYFILVFIFGAQVTSQPTPRPPLEDRRSFEATVPEGRLRVRVQKVLAAPPDPAKQRSGFTGPPGWNLVPADMPTAWRMIATLQPAPDQDDQILWTDELADSLQEPNMLRVLDAKLFDRTVVVLFHCSGFLYAEVATPDVAGYSLLSTTASPPNADGFTLPAKSRLADRTKVALNPGSLRGHITGSISGGDLTVSITGDRSTQRFVLVPDGRRYRWERRGN